MPGRTAPRGAVELDRLRPQWKPLLFWMAFAEALQVGRRVCLVAQRSRILTAVVRASGRLLGLPRGS
jgi:hypothetical protein